MIEFCRERKLPELIIFLQKMVRGTLARRRAKKMAAALKVYKLLIKIDRNYRRYYQIHYQIKIVITIFVTF